MRVSDHRAEERYRGSAIFGCAVVGSLGIFILDGLVLKSGLYYYSDNVYLLYTVAVHRLAAIPWHIVRPLEYLIVLAANYVYLPLWLGASLLCVVGATILSALASERLFGRQLSKAEWWILALANPLLFYVVSQPDTVSQALCNLLFAGALLFFVFEYDQLERQAPHRMRSESGAVFLNLIAAALFFTKETGVAAAIVIPAATILIRAQSRRLSPIFLISLLIPIAAGCGWVWLNLKFQSLLQLQPGERYSLQLSPIAWAKNFIVTMAFPITPLPSSFLGFELLRTVWVAVALASVGLLLWIVLRESRRQPAKILPLLVVAASCAPMVLVRTDELYTSMIAPFVVSIIFLCSARRMRPLSLKYGLVLYAASLGNGIIYCLGSNFNLLGLPHLEYSIYGEQYQTDPTCSVAMTAHVAWDGSVPKAVYGVPGLTGRIICIQ